MSYYLIQMRILIDKLNDATKAYDKGKPYISDSEWDEMYFHLQELEQEAGVFYPDSPTQSITYEVKNALEKENHPHKMLSLAKTKSVDEVKSFMGKNAAAAMCKLDGLTCGLIYENGELVSASTRGNGLVGENILHNARVIPSIPKTIPYKEHLEVDGEIICTRDDFANFADEYKNPRNFAAGSIRLLDARECGRRKLTFVCWDVITSIYDALDNELSFKDKLSLAESWGFTIVPCWVIKNDKIDEAIKLVKEDAEHFGYPIDGVVFKYNDCALSRATGETAHHFGNAIAFKFFDESYPTILLNIEWGLGRTGVLTPIAIFEPVEIDGSVVQRSTLHNVGVMNELSGGKQHIGDTIYVLKANQITPDISKWENNGEGDELTIPAVCPVCGHAVELHDDILVCPNSDCEGQLLNRLDHFAGKKGLDIKGLSKATLEKLMDWGWLEDVTGLFKLSAHRNEWTKRPGFGQKSVDKVLEAIEASKECALDKFIAALGIPLIGSAVAKELVKYFPTWDEFREGVRTGFKFFTIPTFGDEKHKAIMNFDYTEADGIAAHYIRFLAPAAESSQDLNDKVFCVTGKLHTYKNRDEIKTFIESLGGKVSSSVSKNTNYLINNDASSTSSKNVTAKSLGVPIITEDEFIQLLSSAT